MGVRLGALFPKFVPSITPMEKHDMMKNIWPTLMAAAAAALITSY